MKKIVYALFFISFVFIFNIMLFYYSNTYSLFLKNLKYWSEKKDFNNLITDDYLLNNFNWKTNECNCELKNENSNNNDEGNLNDLLTNENILDENILNNQVPNIQNEFIDQKKIKQEKLDSMRNDIKIQRVLSLFLQYSLNLKNYDEYYKIFNLTDEYPKLYLTYLSKNIDIYFFEDNNFEEIYNLFWVLSSDLNLNLNKVDNFWKNAFFINLNTGDNFVRMIIDNWEIIFWLKFEKSYYNEVKNILKKL